MGKDIASLIKSLQDRTQSQLDLSQLSRNYSQISASRQLQGLDREVLDMVLLPHNQLAIMLDDYSIWILDISSRRIEQTAIQLSETTDDRRGRGHFRHGRRGVHRRREAEDESEKTGLLASFTGRLLCAVNNRISSWDYVEEHQPIPLAPRQASIDLLESISDMHFISGDKLGVWLWTQGDDGSIRDRRILDSQRIGNVIALSNNQIAYSQDSKIVLRSFLENGDDEDNQTTLHGDERIIFLAELDHQRIASFHVGGKICIWDLENMQLSKELFSTDVLGRVQAIEGLSNQYFILDTTMGLEIWDLDQERSIGTIPEEDRDDIQELQVLDNGNVITADKKGKIMRWEFPNPLPQHEQEQLAEALEVNSVVTEIIWGRYDVELGIKDRLERYIRRNNEYKKQHSKNEDFTFLHFLINQQDFKTIQKLPIDFDPHNLQVAIKLAAELGHSEIAAHLERLSPQQTEEGTEDSAKEDLKQQMESVRDQLNTIEANQRDQAASIESLAVKHIGKDKNGDEPNPAMMKFLQMREPTGKTTIEFQQVFTVPLDEFYGALYKNVRITDASKSSGLSSDAFKEIQEKVNEKFKEGENPPNLWEELITAGYIKETPYNTYIVTDKFDQNEVEVILELGDQFSEENLRDDFKKFNEEIVRILIEHTQDASKISTLDLRPKRWYLEFQMLIDKIKFADFDRRRTMALNKIFSKRIQDQLTGTSDTDTTAPIQSKDEYLVAQKELDICRGKYLEAVNRLHTLRLKRDALLREMRIDGYAVNDHSTKYEDEGFDFEIVQSMSQAEYAPLFFDSEQDFSNTEVGNANWKNAESKLTSHLLDNRRLLLEARNRYLRERFTLNAEVESMELITERKRLERAIEREDTIITAAEQAQAEHALISEEDQALLTEEARELLIEQGKIPTSLWSEDTTTLLEEMKKVEYQLNRPNQKHKIQFLLTSEDGVTSQIHPRFYEWISSLDEVGRFNPVLGSGTLNDVDEELIAVISSVYQRTGIDSFEIVRKKLKNLYIDFISRKDLNFYPIVSNIPQIIDLYKYTASATCFGISLRTNDSNVPLFFFTAMLITYSPSHFAMSQGKKPIIDRKTSGNNLIMGFFNSAVSHCNKVSNKEIAEKKAIKQANISKYQTQETMAENKRIELQAQHTDIKPKQLHEKRWQFIRKWNNPDGNRVALSEAKSISPNADPLTEFLSGTGNREDRVYFFSPTAKGFYNQYGQSLEEFMKWAEFNPGSVIAVPTFDRQNRISRETITVIKNPRSPSLLRMVPDLPIIRFVEDYAMSVEWQGYSLGELSHSFNLFPGEQKELVVETRTSLKSKISKTEKAEEATTENVTSSFEENLQNEFSTGTKAAEETSDILKTAASTADKTTVGQSKTTDSSSYLDVDASVSANWGWGSASLSAKTGKKVIQPNQLEPE